MNVGDMRKLIEGKPDEMEFVIQDGESEEVLPTGTAQVGHYHDYSFKTENVEVPNAIAIWRY